MAGGGDVCPLGGPPCPECLVAPAAVPGAVHALPGVPAGGQPASASGHGGDHGERGGPVPDGVCLPADFRGPVLGPAAAHPGLVLGAGFDGPPSGAPLGGHPGPDSAADRSAGAPRCPVGLAFAWPGGGGVWGVCVLVPPASSVPVRPGPLCLFRRGPAGGGVLPGLSGHPGAVRLAGPLRRKGAAGPGPAEEAAGASPLGEKTAEPRGSAVMPVSDLFACR